MQDTPNPVMNAQEPRAEIIDQSTREVWQDVHSTPADWYDALELDAPFSKVGLGTGDMDRMWFRRSPGADRDGPYRTRIIGGREFFHCASPTLIEGENPRRILVDKHHTLAFDAGREVQILQHADGRDFVLVLPGAPGAPQPKLPDGWSLRTVRLDAEWIVELPAPAETWWFEGMVSYQGPVDPPGAA